MPLTNVIELLPEFATTRTAPTATAASGDEKPYTEAGTAGDCTEAAAVTDPATIPVSGSSEIATEALNARNEEPSL